MKQVIGRERPGIALWPMVLCGVAGAAVFNLAPLYLAASAQRFALDDRQVGWLMSAEIAGIALASLAVLLLRGRLPMHRVAIGGALCLTIGNLAALQVDSFGAFLAMRLAIGFLGDGLVYVAAIVLLGRQADPVRAFATLSFTNMCFTAGMLWLLPLVLRDVDNEHLAWLFAGLAVAVLLASHRLVHPESRTQVDGVLSTVGRGLPLLGLGGFALFGANLGAVWSYAERLGANIGLESGQAAMLLGISILFQALGSLLAALTSRRIAPRFSLSLVVATQCLAAVMLAQAGDARLYLVAFALWGASWNFGAAHLLGMLSRLSGGQRVLSLAPGTEALGVSLGPLGVGILIGPGLQLGLQIALPVVAVTCVVITTVSFLAVVRHIHSGIALAAPHMH